MGKLIIGLPGLLTKEESGRLELISSQLPEAEYKRVSYVDSTQNGNEKIIGFSLLNSVKALREVLEKIKKNQDISVIASSTGAAVFAYTIEEFGFNKIEIEAYVAISPLYKLEKRIREQLVNLTGKGKDIDISSIEDKNSGRRRLLESSSIEDFLSLDCNALKNKPRINKVLTLVGRGDQRADINEAEKYHRAVGGSNDNMIYLECGHDIPYSISNERILEFLRKSITP